MATCFYNRTPNTEGASRFSPTFSGDKALPMSRVRCPSSSHRLHTRGTVACMYDVYTRFTGEGNSLIWASKQSPLQHKAFLELCACYHYLRMDTPTSAIRYERCISKDTRIYASNAFAPPLWRISDPYRPCARMGWEGSFLK